MDLLFLGTSAGVPTLRRNVSALALLEERGKGWFLVDCGEATQHQVLRSPLSVMALQGICITHVHGDHCYGLPGLLASAAMAGRTQPLPLIAPAEIHAWLQATQALTALHLPFELQRHDVAPGVRWSLGDWEVEAVALSHRVPCHGFRFHEARTPLRLDPAALAAAGVPRGPLWGRLQAGETVEHAGRRLPADDFLVPSYPGRCLVVAGDNDRPELLAEACQGAQVLVHEATYAQAHLDRTGCSHGHSSAQAVAAFAARSGVPNLILTHFSPRYADAATRSPRVADLAEEARAHYQGNLHLAADFARFRLDRAGQLQAVG